MTDVEIRPITLDDDYDAQYDLGQRAFGISPAGRKPEWIETATMRAGQGLFLGAFLGGEPVGAAMVHDMRQYWLGSSVPMAGIAGVKVAPEHRARGIGKRLMIQVLRLTADRGYPLSALYPATMPIYRSLGWELAGAKHMFTIPAHSLRSLVKPDEAAHGGGASYLDVPIRRTTRDDAATVVERIGAAYRAARAAGPLTWDEGPSAAWLARADLYSYLAGDDGFAAYRWADGDLWVEHIHATTPDSLRALWSVIASHSSVAHNVRGWIAPNDPFWWLTYEREATVSRRSMWMLRLVDAPAAIAARGFPPGLSVSVPLELNDPHRPANTGHWRLTVAGGKGTLFPNGSVSSPSSLTLGPRGLAALYAGIPVGSLRLAGLASGGSPEGDASLDAAFAATPYMVDDF
ncbi:MAG TPA: GNAT family N-acetyltransferase [Trebonia sp.]|nr:GNAT family N-acetyltransferase [Trebonia sp.]